jgi:hypothetical protein
VGLRNTINIGVMKTVHSTLKSRKKHTRSATPVGTRILVYPNAGFANLTKRRRLREDGHVYKLNLRETIVLSQLRQEKLLGYQRFANKCGFVVALLCPLDGEVIKTKRTGDLEEGVAAECPKCGKRWLGDG